MGSKFKTTIVHDATDDQREAACDAVRAGVLRLKAMGLNYDQAIDLLEAACDVERDGGDTDG